MLAPSAQRSNHRPSEVLKSSHTGSAASKSAARAVQGRLLPPAPSLVLQGPRARLSQDLVGLWADEYGPALALLRRVLPPGLMRYLNVRQEQPAQAQVNAAILGACMLPTLSRLSNILCTLASMLGKITAKSSCDDSW